MAEHGKSGLGLVFLAAGGMGAAALGVAFSPPGPAARDPEFQVDANVALHALVSLGEAHLAKTADVLTLLAATDAARGGDWERIRGPLADAAPAIVPAVHWFARPDGRYWTIEGGRAPSSLADRPYFGRVLAGHAVIGDLVVSRSTRRNTAIVAVPVHDRDGTVVGVLGSSIHLDSLSALIREEMGGLEPSLFFFAIDREPLGALHSDPEMIFTEPMRLGDAGMRRAFEEILAGREGAVEYSFRGGRRTVLYRKAAVSGWWYGLGRIRGVAPPAP
jgi:hypothetical protein